MCVIKVIPWLFRGVTEWYFCSYKKMVAFSWVAKYNCIGYYINVNDQWTTHQTKCTIYVLHKAIREVDRH